MSYMFPELSYRFPSNLDGPVVDMQPFIILDWSVDMDTTEFSDPVKRAQNLSLVDVAAAAVVPTDFVDYTPKTRRFRLRPSVPLEPSRTYRISLRDRILATTGRRSQLPYQWTFTTAGADVEQVRLLYPANASVQTEMPRFTWAAVGNENTVYRFELDDRFDFTSPIYVAEIPSTGIIPGGTIPEDQTYYWRVRAITPAGSGAWSPPGSFFFGTSANAHPTSKQTWTVGQPFGLAKSSLSRINSNLDVWPPIRLEFTSPPGTGLVEAAVVTKRRLMPRNDQADSYRIFDVPGTWDISGNTAVFLPDGDIEKNTRYEIFIPGDFGGESGRGSGEDIEVFWTGAYTPMYTTALEMRSRFLGSIGHIPDDLINYYIFKASLEAHVRYYDNRLILNKSWGDSLLESFVHDQKNLVSHGVSRWVAAAATYSLLKATLFGSIPRIGLNRRLGDYQESLGADYLKALEAAMKKAEEDLDYWEDYLAGSDLLLTTSRHSLWSPESWGYDWSVKNVEYLRGWPPTNI